MKRNDVFLKQTTLQAVKKYHLHSVQQHQNRMVAQFHTKQQLCTLDLITINGILTQFTEIHVDRAILQTSGQCTRNLHILTA